jgi:hypothetical protein
MSYYGTIEGANAYFEARLHSPAWTESAVADRPKALQQATAIIDSLNFKGYKAAVYAVLLANPSATVAEVYVAEANQELEFPRDADTEVPSVIERACYEIAYALLDERDPEMELEALAVTSHRYGPVATSYERGMSPVEHLVHGIPSMVAWRLLKPFLRDANEVKLSRVS